MTEDAEKKIKILIADDEVEFASTLQIRLKLRKYQAEMVNSGEETLRAVEEDPPDVLLLDLKMPDLDGLEVLARLQEKHADIQVIILTGHGSFGLGVEGMELGAFDYIMKPVDLNVLIAKIEQASASKKDIK